MGASSRRRPVRSAKHSLLRLRFELSRRGEGRVAIAKFETTRPIGCSFYFAIDVKPGFSVHELRAHLDQLELEDVLSYETSEARVPGSFDDRPDDDAEA